MALSLLLAGKNTAGRELLPIRVLVVDDEPLIRWAVCMALKAAGFDAIAARSADEAREIAAQWPPPRVALLDDAPEGAVRDLIADIQRIYPTCRFVLMSTARSPSTPEPCSGTTIHKPFDLADMVRAVNDAAQEEPEHGLTPVDFMSR